MSTPAVIWIVIATIQLCASASMDGKPKTGTHRFAHVFIGTAIAAALLWWGGFFGQGCAP